MTTAGAGVIDSRRGRGSLCSEVVPEGWAGRGAEIGGGNGGNGGYGGAVNLNGIECHHAGLGGYRLFGAAMVALPATGGIAGGYGAGTGATGGAIASTGRRSRWGGDWWRALPSDRQVVRAVLAVAEQSVTGAVFGCYGVHRWWADGGEIAISAGYGGFAMEASCPAALPGRAR